MQDPIYRLRLVSLLLVFLVVSGTEGYVIIKGMPPLDALYMTIITLATVGYREMKEFSPYGKVFTKLRRAGADRVLSPYVIGGRRMAVALLRPTVADFLDVVMHSESLDLEMEEVVIAPGSRAAGRSLREVGSLSPVWPVVVGLKTGAGQMQAGPRGDCVVDAGDTLIVVGTEEQIAALRVVARA